MSLPNSSLQTAAIEIPYLPRLADTWNPEQGSLVSQRVVAGMVRIADATIVMVVGLAIALLYVS